MSKVLTMKTYEVQIIQKLYYYVTVEASSKEEAQEKVFDKDLDAHLDDEEWETNIVETPSLLGPNPLDKFPSIWSKTKSTINAGCQRPKKALYRP